jgi:hypothetical protein
MKRTIFILTSIAFMWIGTELQAQVYMDGSIDLGKNNISEGLYSHLSHIGLYENAKWGIQGGYQLGLIQPQEVIFNSWFGSSYGKIRIRNISLVLGLEYLWTAFSPDMRETNFIVFGRTTINHWQIGLGTNTRTYRLSHKAAGKSLLPEPDGRITEKWNIMYHVRYMLKSSESKWNLTLSLTDYDRFLIQQENNPILNLRFDYKISSPVSLYSELWYKSAGLMVIKVTHFGMFLRAGVLWKI